MYEMYVGAAQLITTGRTAMPSYTCPIDVDSSVAQTVGELVDALDRSRCVVEVGGCTVTLTAPASMIADAGNQIPQQFEQIVVEGGAEIGLGDPTKCQPPSPCSA